MPGNKSTVPLQYLDFELEIGAGRGRKYPLTVYHSPGGEARAMMNFPFDKLALESRLDKLKIALLSSGGTRRSFLTQEEQTVRDFGCDLFDALMSGEIRSLYDVSRVQANQQDRGLRIKLRIQPPELAVVPWEYLCDRRSDKYLSLSTQTPIVRYLEVPQPPKATMVPPPLRVLGMFASPKGLAKLDIECEQARLERATAGLRQRGMLQVSWLDGQTWRDLQRALRREGPWHIFHFVGHGNYDPSKGEGQIALADESGYPELLSADQLATLLADHPQLRLVFLNTCEGAQASPRSPFSGLATALVRAGLPAVVAMQYQITDDAAVEFSRSFYEALADGQPVDASVSEARKAVSVSVTNSLEWGVPVLFMRTPDGVLFSRRVVLEDGQRTAGGDERAADGGQGSPGGDVYNVNITGAATIAIGQGALAQTAQEEIDEQTAQTQEMGALFEAVQREDWQEAERLLEQFRALGPDGERQAELLRGRLQSVRQAGQASVDVNPTGSVRRILLPAVILIAALAVLAWLVWGAGSAGIFAGVTPTASVTSVVVILPDMATTVVPSVTASFTPTVSPAPQSSDTAAPTLTHTPRPTSTPVLSPSPSDTPPPTFLPTPSPWPVRLTDSLGVEMALIAAGEFDMGSTSGSGNERPVHRVFLDAYYIDRYEVTNALYRKCVQAGTCTPPSDVRSFKHTNYYNNQSLDEYPVIWVNWEQARTFCEWRGARLPTEAEWEKAARGGLEGKLYTWGDDAPDCKRANFTGCAGDANQAGSYAPNGYELFDMAGNVWEWVNDYYSSTYYRSSPASNPAGPAASVYRVVRGGAWDYYSDYLRVSTRLQRSPGDSQGSTGFRCARTP